MNPCTNDCVYCGYCCRKSTCPFGTWNKDRQQCEHLIERGGDYLCEIHDEILKDPSSNFSPAFGYGCSSPLNSNRLDKLRRFELG